MDKLFIKCVENSKLDTWLIYRLLQCKILNKYSEMNTNELFEYLYWEYILQEHVMSNCYIQMLLIKYGDELINLVKRYFKESPNIQYNMDDKESKVYVQILDELK